MVWRLDRLGRSLKHLIAYVARLEEKGIGFHSVTESINTETSSGKFMFHVFGALSEFERNLIKERTLAGLEATRARGRQVGRSEKFNDEQKELVRTFYANKNTRSSPFAKWSALERLHYINCSSSNLI